MLFYLYKDVCYLYTFKYKQMKKLACFSVLVLLLFVVSCQSDKKSDSYYDQMNKKATAEELLQRINLPIDKVERKKSIKQLERVSFEKDQSQLLPRTRLSVWRSRSRVHRATRCCLRCRTEQGCTIAIDVDA